MSDCELSPFYRWRAGHGKSVESQTLNLRHLAAAARTDGHAAWRSTAVRAADARWRQNQDLGFHSSPTPFVLYSSLQRSKSATRVPTERFNVKKQPLVHCTWKYLIYLEDTANEPPYHPNFQSPSCHHSPKQSRGLC